METMNKIAGWIEQIRTQESGAIFSPCRMYRYALWRIWDRSKPLCMFTGLNPSTADEQLNDPTIRREIGFAQSWNYGGLLKGNAFGFRSTDPKGLRLALLPIGDDNDHVLSVLAAMADLKIAAWGADSFVSPNRARGLLERLGDVHCLGVTKGGYPKHPLYLKKDLKPMPFGRTTVTT